MYKMYLELGDWSHDGHNQSNKILMQSNHPVEDIQEAYKKSCKLTGMSFNGNAQYHEVDRNYTEQKKFEVCTNYREPELTKECKAILESHGINTKEYCDNMDHDTFIKLWTDFVKLSLPDLVLEETKDHIPHINGWYGNLDDQFGYGLYP